MVLRCLFKTCVIFPRILRHCNFPKRVFSTDPIIPPKRKIKNKIEEKYFGSLVDGKPDGEGILEKGFYRYEGEFKNGKRHGTGKIVYSYGDSYAGEWSDGKMHGKGVYIYQPLSVHRVVFEGEYEHNKAIKGIINLPTGEKIDWKNEENRVESGIGQRRYPNGSIYQGLFSNYLRYGYGIFTRVNGTKHSGIFIDDLEHGPGKLEMDDGSVYEGYWNKGIKHGEFIFIKDGIKKSRTYFHGILTSDNVLD